MKNASKVLAVGSSLLLVPSVGVAAAVVGSNASSGSVEAFADEIVDGSNESAVVQSDTVQGEFSYTQATVASNSYIQKNLATASKYLCGAGPSAESTIAPSDWPLTVDGAVGNHIQATYSDLSSELGTKKMIMSCSCAGNPAGGLATANAKVAGIDLNALLLAAQPEEGVNTVVVTSADGYQIALPLSYVSQHESQIVFEINDKNVDDSMGGTNQLWLGSTPASYFVRDVVAVTLESREEAPESPTSQAMRDSFKANLPNIGVVFGGTVA